MVQGISFVTVIKKRTKLCVTHNNKKIELKLFENNLRSLISLITPNDTWEYIIIDFNSDDVNMEEFVASLPKPNNFTFRVIKHPGSFSKGLGLNYATQFISNPIVFFNDADMMIKTRDIFTDTEELVVKQNKVLFPVCWSFSNPEHTDGWKRDSGSGNVIQKKETVVPYMENKKWGNEDTLNLEYFKKLNMASRPYYGKNFVHQWHPDDLRNINYK